MNREFLAKWLYDEFDAGEDYLEPDACDAEYGAHWPWDEKHAADKDYWLRKADELINLFSND